ncbi:MAG: DUF2844 domain-containing protein [Steroidobacteraceae bacterium]
MRKELANSGMTSKPHIPETLPRIAGALLCAALLATPRPAHSSLGAGVDSLAVDQQMLGGTDVVTPMTTYDLHEIKAASGTTVREYVSREGTVFAIGWGGPSHPNLQQLLGNSYAAYQVAARVNRRGHHFLSINTPDLVASVLRLQRTSNGRIYVPTLVPQGVAVASLR